MVQKFKITQGTTLKVKNATLKVLQKMLTALKLSAAEHPITELNVNN